MSVRPFYVPDITSSCKESMVACNCENFALTLLTVSENKMKTIKFHYRFYVIHIIMQK